MPKKANQKLKILLIKDLLEKKTDENNGINMNDIQNVLESHDIEAERKSIYSDVKTLMEYGMDIGVTKGKYGSYRLLSNPFGFDLAELKFLVDAVQSSKFLTEKKSNELIKKIEALTSEKQSKELQRQVYVKNRIKSMNETLYYNIDAIYYAINNDKKITFKYYEWEIDLSAVGVKERVKKSFKHKSKIYEESPYALMWDNENYYLVAYDDETEKVKHYRVDKMQNIQPVEKSKRSGKEKMKNYDFSSYTNSVFNMYSTGNKETVTLRFKKDFANVIVDRFGKDFVFQPDDDKEYIKFNVKLDISQLFYSWVFGCMGKVEIVAPDYVVNEYKEKLKFALKGMK
ncbi:MAG: WYL domain-containing protein [Clostridiales bacterium]|nr:WYL domain-containing protein [Clostridiales bacterium]